MHELEEIAAYLRQNPMLECLYCKENGADSGSRLSSLFSIDHAPNVRAVETENEQALYHLTHELLFPVEKEYDPTVKVPELSILPSRVWGKKLLLRDLIHALVSEMAMQTATEGRIEDPDITTKLSGKIDFFTSSSVADKIKENFDKHAEMYKLKSVNSLVISTWPAELTSILVVTPESLLQNNDNYSIGASGFSAPTLLEHLKLAQSISKYDEELVCPQPSKRLSRAVYFSNIPPEGSEYVDRVWNAYHHELDSRKPYLSLLGFSAPLKGDSISQILSAILLCSPDYPLLWAKHSFVDILDPNCVVEILEEFKSGNETASTVDSSAKGVNPVGPLDSSAPSCVVDPGTIDEALDSLDVDHVWMELLSPLISKQKMGPKKELKLSKSVLWDIHKKGKHFPKTTFLKTP